MNNDNYQLHSGDCLELLATLPDNSVDSIVTDPPYGLSFMGKKWDCDVPKVEIWEECLRVLKPGGHLLAFAGTRTQHRMAVRIEDAGFEIRDMIAWVYGSGFPKSLDVSKAIDKAAGAERPDAIKGGHMGAAGRSHGEDYINAAATAFKKNITAIVGKGGLTRGTPQTEAAQQWQGWGTALKPALEPITVARKPLEGTVVENVQAHGTGALNIDGCRVGEGGGTSKAGMPTGAPTLNAYGDGLNTAKYGRPVEGLGRWPANLIHDGSEEVTELLNDAARFFYCAKASKKDRDEGLESFSEAKTNDGRKIDADNAYQRGATLRKNIHPTVKPTDLMRYLCRLVTPKGGLVLDPFTGSGSTGKAAMLEGFRFIGAEMNPEYVAIAKARIESSVNLL